MTSKGGKLLPCVQAEDWRGTGEGPKEDSVFSLSAVSIRTMVRPPQKMNPPESNSLSAVPPEAQPQRPHLVPPGGSRRLLIDRNWVSENCAFQRVSLRDRVPWSVMQTLS